MLIWWLVFFFISQPPKDAPKPLEEIFAGMENVTQVEVIHSSPNAKKRFYVIRKGSVNGLSFIERFSVPGGVSTLILGGNCYHLFEEEKTAIQVNYKSGEFKRDLESFLNPLEWRTDGSHIGVDYFENKCTVRFENSENVRFVDVDKNTGLVSGFVLRDKSGNELESVVFASCRMSLQEHGGLEGFDVQAATNRDQYTRLARDVLSGGKNSRIDQGRRIGKSIRDISDDFLRQAKLEIAREVGLLLNDFKAKKIIPENIEIKPPEPDDLSGFEP